MKTKKSFIKIGAFAALILLGAGIYSSCTKNESATASSPQKNSKPDITSRVIEGKTVYIPEYVEYNMPKEAMKKNRQFVNALRLEIKSEIGKQYVETMNKMYAFYEAHNGHFVYDAKNKIGTRDEVWELQKLKSAYARLSEQINLQELAKSLELRKVYKYIPSQEDIQQWENAGATQKQSGHSCKSPVCDDGSSCTQSNCQVGANCLCVGNPSTANCSCT